MFIVFIALLLVSTTVPVPDRSDTACAEQAVKYADSISQDPQLWNSAEMQAYENCVKRKQRAVP